MRQRRKCTVDGCDKFAFGHGFCNMHYKRWKKTGDPGVAGRLCSPRTGCDVEGCEEPHRALGFCATHYRRFLDSGETPTTTIRRLGAEKPPCSRPLCSNSQDHKGLCSRHASRQRNWKQVISTLMTWEKYDQMWLEQEGRCGLCGTGLVWDSKLTHVDHSHATGNIRKLLCSNCNQGLGSFRDDPTLLRTAAAYLET